MPDTLLARLTSALAGRYRIEREIGAGGMATVYLAEDLKHQRPVAVKVLDPNLAVTVGADRFLREIRITASLQHPHILTLIDSGEAGGFLYYVMPFVDGETLRTRLNRAGGALPVDEALRILRELLDALAHSHGQGLVHRDVKPENVMLAGRHALVLDFGVAKAVHAAREGARADRQESGTLTSVGTSLGTPAYMAPEQAAGDPDVDHRADIYSAGLVAYEMLAGEVPFKGRAHEVVAAQVSMAPRPLQELAPQLPPALSRLVMRCLAKRPEERLQSAEAVLAELDALQARDAWPTLWRRLETRLGRAGALGTAATMAVVLVGAVGLLLKSSIDTRWVRTEAIPEILRLQGAGRADSAFIVAEAAMARAPRDSALGAILPLVARETELLTSPSGALVSWAPVDDTTDSWRPLGRTPATVLHPRAIVRVRVEQPGYRTRLLLSTRWNQEDGVTLDPEDAPHPEMVRVDGGLVEAVMPGLSDIPAIQLNGFWMDRHEVSNRDYKRFVDAGGYANLAYWTEPIVSGGRVLPTADAVRQFVDRTGRPGPSTWEGGDHPVGAENLPVGGLSWYEASAYAKFVGKTLPTLHHWNRASGTQMMSAIVTASNFSSRAPRPAQTRLGMSPYGTYDMAGNVREWCANTFGTQRFILGGGWTDPTYAFVDAYAQNPLDRSATNGVRLIKLAENDSTPRTAWASIARQFRDYSRERPVSDEVYRGLRGIFAYDNVPLDVRRESVDSSAADWYVEHVSIATPYGRERMPMRIYVPKRGRGRMQTLLLYPGSNAFYEDSPVDISVYSLDAIVNSGRIVVWPIYASQYEREHTLDSDSPRESAAYRDHVAMWVKDVRRTVDYLQTRADVDTSRIAYFGYSFGGRMAPIFLATEPRFKTAVLAVAGLKMERTRPESDPLNYLPHVTIPVLMLNGEFDHYFPLVTSQRPFFAFLGTPSAQKRHVVYPGGHNVPRTMLIGESLQWLDTYLGPPQR